MPDLGILGLVARLADPGTRREAAQSLARHLGADDLIVFVPDPELDLLLPALGFVQTLPSARDWRSFLAACISAGRHTGRLPFPDAGDTAYASGVAVEKTVLVLVGQAPDVTVPVECVVLLPLIGAAFRNEQAARIASAQSAVARQAAAEAMSLAAALDAVRRELQQALRVRDEFLASISHDLRTPLATIRGLAQLGVRQAGRIGTPEGARLAERLAIVDVAAGKMNAMIGDLLDLTRLETGRPLEITRQSVDLVALVQAVAQDYRHEDSLHGIAIDCAVPELIGGWDADRLERVLTNVLGNAIKYSPDGGEILIRVRSVPDDATDHQWAEVTVQDRGLGIPAADLPHVFERFHRGRNVVGRIKGTGIGLAGARQIVEQHGGSISASSVEGAGTTLTLRLPISDQGTAI